MSTPIDEASGISSHAADNTQTDGPTGESGETPTQVAADGIPSAALDGQPGFEASRPRRFAPKRSKSTRPAGEEVGASQAALPHGRDLAQTQTPRTATEDADPRAAAESALPAVSAEIATQALLLDGVDPVTLEPVSPPSIERPARSRTRRSRTTTGKARGDTGERQVAGRTVGMSTTAPAQFSAAAAQPAAERQMSAAAESPADAAGIADTAREVDALAGLPSSAEAEIPSQSSPEPVAKRPARRRTRSRKAASSGAVEAPEHSGADTGDRLPQAIDVGADLVVVPAVAAAHEAPADAELVAESAAEPERGESTVEAVRTGRQRRARPARRRGSNATGTPEPALPIVGAAEAIAKPVFGPAEDGPEPAASALADASQVDSTPQQIMPAAGWTVEEPLFMTSPGGDLDGTEALARSLLDMFQPDETDLAAPAPEAADGEDEEVAEDDQDELPEDDRVAGLADSLADAEGTDAARRRGRRGRRGGRGRRRGALHVVPASGADADVIDLPAGVDTPAVAEPAAAPPELSDGSYAAMFTPDTEGRTERSWRERGPQRRWGRTFTRSNHSAVTMPPPKPSQSGRFAPIPQAVPPAPIALPVPPQLVLSAAPIEVPDLRTDEPLAPGETKTERLLEVQNRLLRAMIEGQGRQIETLSANVSALNKSFQDLAAATSVRAFKPKTAIFVDAPNVCYAAANARVSIDYGRMLKYLSRDRHLVHALSYSPIIDDVREGIRYETQRFVAPFLRTGYKLITKPLKRFSDGSAKGNFDLELALDILTMADRLDVVVLVSGDSDFECVIEHIQQKGVRVEVVAFAANVSTELVNIADSFIDIMQHIDHFKAL